MSDSLYTIVYATVLGTVCALLLAGAAVFTEPYKESNRRAEEMRNILAVLDVPLAPGAGAEELVAMFEKNVRQEERSGLKAYVYIPAGGDGTPRAVAFPFSGPGLWGPIKGFLSLDPAMETIRGITFYEHEETPGLGGEISQPWFRNQFKGKTIRNPSGIRIVRGGATGPNEVDAITGATLTGDKVEAMLNRMIDRLTKESAHGG